MFSGVRMLLKTLPSSRIKFGSNEPLLLYLKRNLML
jgi:hypothetical protein